MHDRNRCIAHVVSCPCCVFSRGGREGRGKGKMSGEWRGYPCPSLLGQRYLCVGPIWGRRGEEYPYPGPVQGEGGEVPCPKT